jgi:hypothetical protein
MPKIPEQHTLKEHQPLPYYLAASFLTRQEGQEPHKRVKQNIEHDETLDLSSFRFERQPRDPNEPPHQPPWHIVILGETPPEPVQQQFQQILRAGELTQLSLETIVTLAQRRAQEARPGIYREIQHGQGKRNLNSYLKSTITHNEILTTCLHKLYST